MLNQAEIDAKIIAMITTGDLRGARAALSRLAKSRVSRPQRLGLARACRNLGMHYQCIGLLGSIEKPTDLEKAEHAAALINVGGVHAGRKLLEGIDGNKFPNIWWLRAFALVREWNWHDAVPMYEAYLRAPSLTEEEKFRGRTYLATALIHGPALHGRAQALLEPILKVGQRGVSALPRQIALLSLSQSLILEEQFREARAIFRELERSIEKSALPPLQATMKTQWEQLYALASGRERKRSWRLLTGPVRQQFESINAWEWARSCWVFGAELENNSEVLRKLWFGTPYGALRRRLEKRLGPVDPGSTYDWLCGSKGRAGAAVLDIEGGFAGPYRLKHNSLPHRLLKALASDLYRPHSLVELHEQAYQGEVYHGEHSADRVHKGLRHLRAWIAKGSLPLRLEPKANQYRLVASAPFSIRLRSTTGEAIDPRCLEWVEKAFGSFGPSVRSARQIARALSMSLRSCQRRLNDAAKRGLLVRLGRGPQARYMKKEHVPAAVK